MVVNRLAGTAPWVLVILCALTLSAPSPSRGQARLDLSNVAGIVQDCELLLREGVRDVSLARAQGNNALAVDIVHSLVNDSTVAGGSVQLAERMGAISKDESAALRARIEPLLREAVDKIVGMPDSPNRGFKYRPLETTTYGPKLAAPTPLGEGRPTAGAKAALLPFVIDGIPGPSHAKRSECAALYQCYFSEADEIAISRDEWRQRELCKVLGCYEPAIVTATEPWVEGLGAKLSRLFSEVENPEPGIQLGDDGAEGSSGEPPHSQDEPWSGGSPPEDDIGPPPAPETEPGGNPLGLTESVGNPNLS